MAVTEGPALFSSYRSGASGFCTNAAEQLGHDQTSLGQPLKKVFFVSPCCNVLLPQAGQELVQDTKARRDAPAAGRAFDSRPAVAGDDESGWEVAGDDAAGWAVAAGMRDFACESTHVRVPSLGHMRRP